MRSRFVIDSLDVSTYQVIEWLTVNFGKASKWDDVNFKWFHGYWGAGKTTFTLSDRVNVIQFKLTFSEIVFLELG